VDSEPKIIAGGVPVVPFNAALKYRARHDGATRKSLATYARAGALYATYCAHQGVGLLDIANDEFPSFVDGLLGLKFRNAGGDFVHLDGHARSRASADLYLTLLYSLTVASRPTRCELRYVISLGVNGGSVVSAPLSGGSAEVAFSRASAAMVCSASCCTARSLTACSTSARSRTLGA
jgi:hypothetical protein